jgi:mono/diheme cytochrome c family protein
MTLGWLAPGTVFGDDPPASRPDFKTQVLPILEAKCIRCHGAKRKGGQLDMQTEKAMLTGGVSGPAFKPGNATKSLMIEMIHYKEMPPKREQPKVSKEELELLRAWINSMPKTGP